MVTPRHQEYSVIIRPDHVLWGELLRLTSGLDASKLLHPPQPRIGVSDALQFMETQLWLSLGADQGEFQVECHRVHPSDVPGADEPGAVVDVRRNWGRDPVPADVVAQVQLEFDRVRDELGKLLTEYRRAMETTGVWPE
jgi:hypothetical protein